MPLTLSEQPMLWVFLGDSITQGVLHTHGQRNWFEHVSERVRWQLGRTRDIFINSGVSGWDTANALGSIDWILGQFAPSAVSIAFGMNDSVAGRAGRDQFRVDLEQLVDISRKTGAQVVIHTPNPIAAEAFDRRGDIAGYAQVVREVAVSEGLHLVDHYLAWWELSRNADLDDWRADPIHPNAIGHRAMARLTLETLGLGDLDQRTITA